MMFVTTGKNEDQDGGRGRSARTETGKRPVVRLCLFRRPDSMIHEDFPFFPTQKEHAAHAQVSRDQRKAERHHLRLSPASEPGGPRLPANPWGRLASAALGGRQGRIR